MKASETMAVLKRRMEKHGDIEVKVTWENTDHAIDPDSIYMGTDGILYIDADNNFYKPGRAIDPHEGEDEVGQR